MTRSTTELPQHQAFFTGLELPRLETSSANNRNSADSGLISDKFAAAQPKFAPNLDPVRLLR